jgi:hypothetical protein
VACPPCRHSMHTHSQLPLRAACLPLFTSCPASATPYPVMISGPLSLLYFSTLCCILLPGCLVHCSQPCSSQQEAAALFSSSSRARHGRRGRSGRRQQEGQQWGDRCVVCPVKCVAADLAAAAAVLLSYARRAAGWGPIAVHCVRSLEMHVLVTLLCSRSPCGCSSGQLSCTCYCKLCTAPHSRHA